MQYATATTKGQITIPASIRKELNIEPGTRVLFVPTESGYELCPMKEDPLKSLKGMFSNNEENLPIDELVVAAERAVAQDYAHKFGSQSEVEDENDE